MSNLHENRASIDFFVSRNVDKDQFTEKGEGNNIKKDAASYTLISNYVNQSTEIRRSCSDLFQNKRSNLALNQMIVEIPNYFQQPKQLKPITVSFFLNFI